MAEKEHAAVGDAVLNSLDDFLSYFEGDGPPAGRPVVVCRSVEDETDCSDVLFTVLSNFSGWHIVIDEVDKFCSPQQLPRPLGNLINFRRHYGIQLTVVARRASRIHKDLTALASTIYLFRAHGRLDLDFIKGEVGEEYSDRCRSLNPREHIRIEIPGGIR